VTLGGPAADGFNRRKLLERVVRQRQGVDTHGAAGRRHRVRGEIRL
jgi:hypothetical protein